MSTRHAFLKTSAFVLVLLGSMGLVATLRADPSAAFQGRPAPAPGRVAQSLFWVADTRKMDEFLNYFSLSDVRIGAYAGETLPDTRSAWHDYALEAVALAQEGREADAAERIAQMLKLAAVYRSFGGLQNVVQAVEIADLAGRTTEKLGKSVAILVHSPYVEKDASDSLIALESEAGTQKEKLTPSCWEALEKCVVNTHYRLALCGGAKIAASR